MVAPSHPSLPWKRPAPNFFAVQFELWQSSWLYLHQLKCLLSCITIWKWTCGISVVGSRFKIKMAFSKASVRAADLGINEPPPNLFSKAAAKSRRAAWDDLTSILKQLCYFNRSLWSQLQFLFIIIWFHSAPGIILGWILRFSAERDRLPDIQGGPNYSHQRWSPAMLWLPISIRTLIHHLICFGVVLCPARLLQCQCQWAKLLRMVEKQRMMAVLQ